MAISLLDTWASDNANSINFSVSSGDDRALFVGICIEGPPPENVPSCTYGGQTMTLEANATTSGGARVTLFSLMNAGISAASGTLVDVSVTSGTCSLSVGSYQGVAQTSNIVDIFEIVTEPGETPSQDIDTEDGGLIVAVHGCGSATTVVWTAPMVEQTDETAAPTTASGSCAHLVPTTGATVGVEAETALANPNRTHVACVSYRQAATAVEVSADGDGSGDSDASVTRGRNRSATGDGVATSDANAFVTIRRPVSADGDGVGDSDSSAHRRRNRSSTGDGDAEASASYLRRRGRSADGDGVGDSSSDYMRRRERAAQGDADGDSDVTAIRANLASATGDGTGEGTATPFVLSVTRGSGVGGANASVRRNRSVSATADGVGDGSATPFFDEDGNPTAPILTLAESFQDAERPVIMIDLEFDSGSINVWSLPFDGVYLGREYQAFAGLTGGVSFRNSLDKGSPDASADLSGSSAELVNIALSEPFQNRVARIRIGNLGDDDKKIEASETLFVGRMVNMPVVIDTDGTEVAVEINSIFGDLNTTPDLRLTDSDQASVDKIDKIFSRVETTRVTNPRFGA